MQVPLLAMAKKVGIFKGVGLIMRRLIFPHFAPAPPATLEVSLRNSSRQVNICAVGNMRVAIIGAGPSGLVTLKYLTTAHEFILGLKPIEAKVFEVEDDIGGTFRYRTYEDAELVSSKYLTCFSDFRANFDEPQFMKVTRYLECLDDYVERFRLRQHIHLCTPVLSVRRQNAGHVVRYRPAGGEEEEWDCDAIAVCTGLNVTAAIPEISGIENVPVSMHSVKFKGRGDFGENKTVVILGAGETAMDIAYMAANSPTKRVVLCHKNGWVNAPKLLPETDFFPYFSSKPVKRDQYKNSPGVPLDVAHSSVFDSSYVHPIIRDSMIPWNFHHYVMAGLAPWVLTGTFGVWDQWVGMPTARNHHLNRSKHKGDIPRLWFHDR